MRSYGRHLALVTALVAVAACGSEIGELPGTGAGSADSGSLPTPDAAPVADADVSTPDAATDAGVEPEPDAKDEPPMGTPATVTAECLFLRMGPGTDQPKVPCIPGGIECNVDNDVCMPLGETFNVTGTPKTGAGCAQWYPGTYESYEGYACGDYLEFPAAAQLVVPKGPTLYPSTAAGPQG